MAEKELNEDINSEELGKVAGGNYDGALLVPCRGCRTDVPDDEWLSQEGYCSACYAKRKKR